MFHCSACSSKLWKRWAAHFRYFVVWHAFHLHFLFQCSNASIMLETLYDGRYAGVDCLKQLLFVKFWKFKKIRWKQKPLHKAVSFLLRGVHNWNEKMTFCSKSENAQNENDTKRARWECEESQVFMWVQGSFVGECCCLFHCFQASNEKSLWSHRCCQLCHNSHCCRHSSFVSMLKHLQQHHLVTHVTSMIHPWMTK